MECWKEYILSAAYKDNAMSTSSTNGCFRALESPAIRSFGRFFKRLTVPVLNNLFAQFIKVPTEYDSITFEEAFIDGTKIEANANRYTFVWKKNVIKSLGKLKEKLSAVCQKLLALTGVDASA